MEERRADWRAKRDAGEVSLTDLMPLETDAERRWAYYVPQPIPDDAVQHAPESVRDLKILDPAVGSGHFLVVAFDLLHALYHEEARHRGETREKRWTEAAIVERILEHNLHGIDLDPRAAQIAAAALWLKAQLVAYRAAGAAASAGSFCPVTLPRLNLVASNLGISRLPDNDPALVELRRAIEAETGIPGKLTMQIVEALRGADHLGSLLKIDAAIEQAIAAYEEQTGWKNKFVQITFDEDGQIVRTPRPISREWATTGVLSAIEDFLSRHTGAQELGLRMHGEQLAAGVRFVRLVKEGTYDLVVANPPYQGTSKIEDAKYVAKHYTLGKENLYSAFLLRGLALVRDYGTSAMLTLRDWMFINQFADMRTMLLSSFDLRVIGDFIRGAFEDIPDEIVSVAVTCFLRAPCHSDSVAQCPSPRDDRSRDNQRTQRKRAASLCHVGRHIFDTSALKNIPEWPVVYWWVDELQFFRKHKLLDDIGVVRQGLATGDNPRYLRRAWEVQSKQLRRIVNDDSDFTRDWAPYIKGAAGQVWCESLDDLIRWSMKGTEKRVAYDVFGTKAGNGTPSEALYFTKGVAFTSIGNAFSSRAHRFRSIIGHTASSVFGLPLDNVVCWLNSRIVSSLAESLNPTISFQVGDVKRLPYWEIPDSRLIFAKVEAGFTIHESHREPSVEFEEPGPSPWRNDQKWAQLAVDRPEGAPLPEYVEELDPEPPTDHVSFAVGVALGRFGADGEGIRDPGQDDLSSALPHGIMFLNGTLQGDDFDDSLGHGAARIIHEKWAEYGPRIDPKRSLRDWLRERFFPNVHKGMYENRPIHWPLSSEKKTFVAWVTIHRWNEQTLRVLLGDHLEPALKQLDGEITDLTAARGSGDKNAARAADDRYSDIKAWRDELAVFIEQVRQCAERGPAPPDPKKPERETDARYAPDLDDGVMINSSALWPLLDPQWKDPKKWWKELVAAKGKKDYDWSHLAMRYWPTRVDEKCRLDPSLGVAHGCFWKYHPARAWAWELRLQDEIGPEFRIEEAPYRGDGGDVEHRAVYLRDNSVAALAAIEKEVLRRRRKRKQPQSELRLLETGLWSAVPGECWELELALTEKQQVEFKLLSPDEPEARARFERKHPNKVKARKALLSKLRPAELFGEPEDEEAAEADEAEDLEVEEVDA